ncbi:MAG TPA: ISNCY family transposase [Methylomirabilota bacterium]|nr:ISNCY family transposase [Methylomirabilota bacterium]
MSRKEAPRAGLVKAALAGRITNAQGAQALGMSRRQFRRLKARYREAGVRGLVHRLRGRPSSRAVDVEVRERVRALVDTTYRDLNDCHATEKLREVEGLDISRSTVRRLRRRGGRAAKRRRRPPQHRARRPRRAAAGALVLIDGSAFDWLGTGTPWLLLGAIDDATGTVLALHFRPAEDLHGYLTLLRGLAERHGLPVSLYGDRLGVFVRNDAHWSLEEELQGAQHPTHFGQVLRDLGIGYIAAHSPQAKGRIERLWETLQDRVVAELRLRGLQTLAAAEAYLPTYLLDHNRRFARPPAVAGAAWRPPPRDLADRLSCRYTRRVARDNTVRLGPRIVQIPRGPHGRSYAGCRVALAECLDGRLLISYQGRRLATALAPAPPFLLVPQRAARLRAARTAAAEGGPSRPRRRSEPGSPLAALTALARHLRRPPPSHPWRRLFSRRQPERPGPFTPTEGGHFH